MSQTEFPASAKAIIARLAAIDYRTVNLDKARIEAGLMQHLTALEQPLRPVYWAPDIAGAIERIRDRAKRTNNVPANNSAAAWDAAWDAARAAAWAAARAAAWDAARAAAWDAALSDPVSLQKMTPAQRAAVEKAKAMEAPLTDCWEAGLWIYIVTPTEVIAVPRPELHMDDRQRLHNATGPAMMWQGDGARFWFWRGVAVPQKVIDAPHTITLDEISNEKNAEVRRVMIERYGQEKYLLDAGAAAVQQDGYGILYRKELPDDEPLVMVHVLNSTPEPDGTMTREDAERTFGKAAVASALTYASSQGIDCTEPRFKTYFIRVPPDIETAHAGVAWTFDKTPQQYHPLVQT